MNWIKALQRRWPEVDLQHDTYLDPVTQQVITTDMLVEGVHFSWDYCTPYDVGWKAIAASLSDVAATGGKPDKVVISLGVPHGEAMDRLNALYDGIDDCCMHYSCTVVGGDTVRANFTTISVTVIGHLPEHCMPGRRNTAREGHVVAISGPHGLSRAGLYALQNNIPGFERAKTQHLRPKPQLRLGESVSRFLPHYAMMDTSDGLADAACRVAAASNVDIVINAEMLAIDPEVAELAAMAQVDPLEWVLYGGEDFELFVTMPNIAIQMLPQGQFVGIVEAPRAEDQGQAFFNRHGELAPFNLEEKTFQHFAHAAG